jgi:arylsulfatase
MALPVSGALAQKATKAPPVKPNVIFILADDLGYAELGCYGQKRIETPNIDALAKSGMIFTQAYTSAPVSAPARCCLLTGRHTGHSIIRGNDEMGKRGDVWNYEKASLDPNLEGQAPLPAETFTMGKLFRQAGYATACIGKWGLGGPLTESTPGNMGFDFFFGYNCQRQAHNYYPNHLWKNDEKVMLHNEIRSPNAKLLPGADPFDPASYALFSQQDYAPELMLEQTLQFIETHHNKPFFLYFSTTLPHVALQAPAHWVDYYVKKFGDEKPYPADQGYLPNRYPHATYAAMISYLDEQVGIIIDKLREAGIYDNTLIVFTSDNGPTYAGGVDPEYFSSAAPFIGTSGWGKGSLHEGGIREPLVVSWPGHVPANSKSETMICFQDFMPTFTQIIGENPRQDYDGINMLNAFTGKKQKQHKYLYFEFPEYGGQQAVRMGKWKAYRDNLQKEDSPWQLFDLSADIREQHNVADHYPAIIRKVKAITRREHIEPDNPKFRIKALVPVMEE